MIIGAHAIIYSKSPGADRDFLRDVLSLPHVDVGDGWLIFGLPPAELAVHPSDRNDVHEFYFMCADVEAFVAAMEKRRVKCGPVQDQGWGLLTQVTLPGGGKLGVYQPRHARPRAMSLVSRSRKPIAPKTRVKPKAIRKTGREEDRATLTMPAAPLIETPRLCLRPFKLDDADFILELLNDPAFLQYIGDKGVRNPDEARDYLRKGPLASYDRFGFGLLRVALKEGTSIGMCGLLKRDTLDHADLGFAFLPRFRAQGYAFESAVAVLAYARAVWGVERVLAIASPDNVASIGLLEKLGFAFERQAQLTEAEPPIKLYARA